MEGKPVNELALFDHYLHLSSLYTSNWQNIHKEFLSVNTY